MSRPARADYVTDVRLSLVTIVVNDYDAALQFYVGILGFELSADEPAVASGGELKRWVVVRPPGGQTGVLLAEAAGERQWTSIGAQTGGRVAFFLEVDDLESHYRRLVAAGVEFESEPRSEPYGRVAVFVDIAGNRWDLIEPAVAFDR